MQGGPQQISPGGKGGQGRQRQFIVELGSLPLAPPGVFPFMVSGFIFCVGIGGGVTNFHTGKPPMSPNSPQGGIYPLLKGNKSWKLPPRGRPALDFGDSPGLGTLAVTHGGRFFFFFFFFFFFCYLLRHLF
eukprot:FR737801.1.p1 GENE.FR737801.1~~FR737801.1.p1  ORF type:complete len:131 (-),score=42.79 FR737801.1:630-1022(-)